MVGCFSSHCQKMSKVGNMRRERLCMLLGMNLTRVKGSAFETGLT